MLRWHSKLRTVNEMVGQVGALDTTQAAKHWKAHKLDLAPVWHRELSIPVILNLQSAETDLAKRLIDFSSGLTYALDGGMQRVADKVFMLTPRNVEISAEERARLLEKGFFNQY